MIIKMLINIISYASFGANDNGGDNNDATTTTMKVAYYDEGHLL